MTQQAEKINTETTNVLLTLFGGGHTENINKFKKKNRQLTELIKSTLHKPRIIFH